MERTAAMIRTVADQLTDDGTPHAGPGRVDLDALFRTEETVCIGRSTRSPAVARTWPFPAELVDRDPERTR